MFFDCRWVDAYVLSEDGMVRLSDKFWSDVGRIDDVLGRDMRNKNGKYLDCLMCNRNIYVPKYRTGTFKYCSKECSYKSMIGKTSPMRGRKHSSETLEKMSKTWFKKGVPPSIDVILKRSRKIIGIARPEEVREKIRIKTKQSWEKGLMQGVFPKGPRHHWWKGGASSFYSKLENSSEYKQWRIAVFKRDGRTCRDCGIHSKSIEAHHITPLSILYQVFLNKYPQFSPLEDQETLLRLSLSFEDFWDINNGLTLCRDCHKKTDTYGAKHKWRNRGIYK